MKGFCEKTGHGRVGFGECKGKVLPALTEAVNEPEQPDKVKKEELEIYYDFKLYGYWKSSSTWRVRVALVAKGIAYETIPVDIFKGECKLEEHVAKNPLGQIPFLEVTDRRTGQQLFLSQSVAIIEFLDEAFPARKSLLPKDPLERAIAREMVELINAGTQPLQNLVLLRELEEKSEGKINVAERAKAVNEHGLMSLEVLVKRHRNESSGPYCLGSYSPSIVDAVNARRFGVDVDELCPELAAIEKECLGHPWFQASHPGMQPDAELE
jgi:maleylacetoacetate isomerase